MDNVCLEALRIDERNLQDFEKMRIGNYGFLICKEGCIILRMDGNIYEIHPGDLYVYPAFAETKTLKTGYGFMGIAGIADFDTVMSFIHSVSGNLSYIQIRFHPLVSLDDEQVRRIEELIGCIERRANMHMELKEQVNLALRQAICYEIVGVYMEKIPVSQERQSRKDKILQKFICDLHEHFMEHRDVAFYAGLQYITPRHFATQIQDRSGRTPLQWIAMFTIIEAKRLLDNPKMSIKETAEKLHFPEQASFGRYFKQHTGISPTAYRQRKN